MNLPLIVNIIYSIIAFKVTKRLIPRLRDMFLNANLAGNDLNKFDKPRIPEAMGVVSGCIFLVTLFFFIPIPFGKILFKDNDEIFPHDEFVELIASMLSICCMLLLGFADDVLNLKWRHKLLLPTIATLPLLMVYYVNFNSTTIIMPHFIRYLIGTSVDIGFLYYIFMGMLAVFCTNAINILAGINGLEVGQSLVIAASIIIFNTIELLTNLDTYKGHLLSLYFILPYFGTSVGLWIHNRYPSSVFVGDTFCYLSGMTFAVVGILGHFSKTLLLFFIPQVFNFLYSIPQLFHFVPCPRHRMPKYNIKTKLLDPSKTLIHYNELPLLGRFFIKLFDKFYLLSMEKIHKDSYYINNLTLINLILVLFGAKHEKHLTYILICLQIFCTFIAFAIRYPLAKYFYG